MLRRRVDPGFHVLPERLGSVEQRVADPGVLLHELGDAAARETGSLMPPKHILNAPTRLMKDLGYGRGYEYDHEAPDAFSGQSYLPEDLERRRFYYPSERGFEREIAARLAEWEKLRAARATSR